MLTSLDLFIALGIFATSTLSGIMGMGGGMILMVLLLGLLPVEAAMILHGVNSDERQRLPSRHTAVSLEWQDHWPLLTRRVHHRWFVSHYSDPARQEPSAATAGALSLSQLSSENRSLGRYRKRFRPVLCGGLVSAAQLLAGASGGVLDVFYVHSKLSRFEVIGNKAFT